MPIQNITELHPTLSAEGLIPLHGYLLGNHHPTLMWQSNAGQSQLDFQAIPDESTEIKAIGWPCWHYPAPQKSTEESEDLV